MRNPRIIILGPCAAESEQQVLSIAKALKNELLSNGFQQWIFRAGIWKPRTSPHSFQGIGTEGLNWLQRIQQELAIPCATEVATVNQLQDALDAGIYHLWIGARTSANPIQVQLLADALKERSEKPFIYIKNPVNNDANLWIGNIQRIEAVIYSSHDSEDTGRCFAIHRGCNHHPCWEMAYALRQQLPHIPLLIDPSHMSGDVSQINHLCTIGAKLQYDGVMIEVHNDPAHALSDSNQQFTPDKVCQLLCTVVNNHVSLEQPTLQLQWLRQMMDEVDDELWNAIAKRMEVSKRIGDYKRKNHIEVTQPARFDEIVFRRLAWAKAHHFDDDQAIKDILNILHEQSIKTQLE